MNSSGPISLAGTTAGQSIEIENGGNGTTQISLNDTAVRNLAGVPSGQIVMPTDFYGKSNIVNISYTFSANTANASLNVTTISGYVAGKSNITITVNSGIYLYSTNTANAGLTLTGGSTGDTITLVNNGYIMGMGGKGGDGAFYPDQTQYYTYKTAGGPALSLGFDTTINNTNASAYIGGGGGGGAGTQNVGSTNGAAAGGGAGGGAGGTYYYYGSSYGTGGSGGSVGATGGNGTYSAIFVGECGYYPGGGGGGGRIFPGTGGAGGTDQSGTGTGVTGKGGGSGGGGGVVFGLFGSAIGGAGGSSNSAGGNSTRCGGGGGGWGASGGTQTWEGIAGGAGGKAVALNGKTVTWVSGNTTRVYGAVS